MKKYVLLFNFFFDLDPKEDMKQMNKLLKSGLDLQVKDFAIIGEEGDIESGRSIWICGKEDFIKGWKMINKYDDTQEGYLYFHLHNENERFYFYD